MVGYHMLKAVREFNTRAKGTGSDNMKTLSRLEEILKF